MTKIIVNDAVSPDQPVIIHYSFKLTPAEWLVFWQWSNTAHMMAEILQAPLPARTIGRSDWGGARVAKHWLGLSDKLADAFDGYDVHYGVKVEGKVS